MLIEERLEMKRIETISIFILAVLLTLTYFLNATIANSYMTMILFVDVLMVAMLLLSPKAILKTPKSVIILCFWVFLRQFIYSGISFSQLPTLFYHGAAPIVAYTLISSVSEENGGLTVKVDNLVSRKSNKLDFAYLLIILWCVIYILYVEPQRGLRNWGYANYIYLVYALFPLVFMSKKKVFQYVTTALLIVATIVSKKRTAVILLVVYAVVFSWRAFTRKKTRTYQFLLITVALVAIVALSYSTSFFENISTNYLYRFDTSNDDNWNGRFAIWSYGLARWWSGNIFDIIFGNNITYSYSASSVELTMHNDYLEMLTNYGIVGLIMTISFIVWLVKRTRRFGTHNFEDYNTVSTFTCVNYLVLMVTSHIIIYPYLMALCLAPIAFCEGMERRASYENRAY